MGHYQSFSKGLKPAPALDRRTFAWYARHSGKRLPSIRHQGINQRLQAAWGRALRFKFGTLISTRDL